MGDEWYYARDNQQRGPVSHEQVRSMLVNGSLRPSDLVWTDGMPQWLAVARVPELAIAPTPAQHQQFSPSPANTPEHQFASGAQVLGYAGGAASAGAIQLTPRALELLRLTRPWVRFIAILIFVASGFMLVVPVFMILAAVLGNAGSELGLISLAVGYLVSGLLYLMPGVYLNRYASRIAELERTGREDVLEAALEAQKSFWKFIGVVTIIGFLLGVGGAVLMGLGLAIFS